MKTVYNLIALGLFGLVVFSLFLPNFRTITDGMEDESYSFISQYPNPDQSGFFGGGYYTTYNGFGSINALFIVFISFFTLILIFVPNLKRKALILPTILLIISFALTLLERIMAPYLLSDPDKLFSGFYLSRIAVIGIFFIAFGKAKRNSSKPSAFKRWLNDEN